LKHPDDVAFILTTDGVQTFKTGTGGCWPIYLINCNLAPDIRNKKEHMWMLGIIPGSAKDIHKYLEPLIQKFLELQRNGVAVYNAYTKQYVTVRAHLLFVTGDILQS
jgi:hypothetical protein